MVLVTLGICLVFIFSLIFFVDFMLKSCMVYPYVLFLENRGLSIKPFVIQWETTRFNRFFRRLGLMHPRFVRKWFEAGVLLVSVGVIPVVIMLAIPIFDSVRSTLFPCTANLTSNNAPLALLIPGVNIPFTHLLYIVTVTFISVIVHEVGHAIAACRERVFPISSGFAFKYFMPIAYVNLPTEQLNQLSNPQKMRIFSAGIWHNVVLGLMALLLLTMNTWILSPVFHKNHGVTVVDVNELSGAALPGGFENGDQITFVDNCQIYSPNDWTRCFENMMTSPQRGYCTSEDLINAENSAVSSTNVEDCCESDDQNLCFKHNNIENNHLMCLPGRKVAENASACHSDKECLNKLCLVPVFSPDSSERFIKVFRRYKKPVFFVGSVRELYTSVTVSEWVSKYESLSIGFLVKYELFLKFFMALSASIALINLVPCYGFDGQFLSEVLVHHFLVDIITRRSQRAYFIKALNLFGTILLVLNLIKGILNYPILINNKFF